MGKGNLPADKIIERLLNPSREIIKAMAAALPNNALYLEDLETYHWAKALKAAVMAAQSSGDGEPK